MPDQVSSVLSHNPIPPDAPLLVPRPVAAKWLGVCPNTIGNLQRRGELVPVRIGSRVLFDRRDLLAFIDARKGVAR